MEESTCGFFGAFPAQATIQWLRAQGFTDVLVAGSWASNKWGSLLAR